MSDNLLTDSLAALTRFYVDEGTLLEALDRVARLMVSAVEPAALAGITMDVDGRTRTAVFTDELAPQVDQAQYDNGDEPCLTAFREGRVTLIDSTLEPGEWQRFRDAAAAHGLLSTLSLPLVAANGPIGALNLYARKERAFDAESRATAEEFASHAAIVLANCRAYWDKHELSIGLAEAMKNRATIEQAKGILMGAQRIDEDAAFDLLVKASQRENVKLREIARRIVAGAAGRGATGQG